MLENTRDIKSYEKEEQDSVVSTFFCVNVVKAEIPCLSVSDSSARNCSPESRSFAVPSKRVSVSLVVFQSDPVKSTFNRILIKLTDNIEDKRMCAQRKTGLSIRVNPSKTGPTFTPASFCPLSDRSRANLIAT